MAKPTTYFRCVYTAASHHDKAKEVTQSMLTRLFAIAAFGAMSACGGSPFDLEEATPFGPISDDAAAVLAASFDTLSADVTAITPTVPGGMDNSGRATFSGMAELVVTPEAGTGSMTLVGDANLTANFDSLMMTADMNNFAGVDMSGAGQRLDGSLIMDNGMIGASHGNGFAGNFRGRLVADSYEIVADGIMDGTFRGTPVSAVSFSGLDDTALLDGDRANLRLTGIAQE
jgi:hypothetical protein